MAAARRKKRVRGHRRGKVKVKSYCRRKPESAFAKRERVNRSMPF